MTAEIAIDEEARRVLTQRASASFDKFTPRARKVLLLARDEAVGFNHTYIGTEHLLLGLIREGSGIAAVVLRDLDIALEPVQRGIEAVIGRGPEPPKDEPLLTPRAETTLALAASEAWKLRHDYIGTEHLLLGIIHEGEGVAAGAIESQGVPLEQVRARVLQAVSQIALVQSSRARAVKERATDAGATRGNVVTCRIDDRDLEALDALIEAGIRTTRSDAASWLIHAGIEAHQPLLERVRATVAEIRQLRTDAQVMAQQLAAPASLPDEVTQADSAADKQ